ncbi:hypothetical protein F4824DRAFT_483085, partial [Ustulina deusta]
MAAPTSPPRKSGCMRSFLISPLYAYICFSARATTTVAMTAPSPVVATRSVFSGLGPVIEACRSNQWFMAAWSDKGARKPMEEVAGSPLTQRYRRYCSDGRYLDNVEVSPKREMTSDLPIETSILY